MIFPTVPHFTVPRPQFLLSVKIGAISVSFPFELFKMCFPILNNGWMEEYFTDPNVVPSNFQLIF